MGHPLNRQEVRPQQHNNHKNQARNATYESYGCVSARNQPLTSTGNNEPNPAGRMCRSSQAINAKPGPVIVRLLEALNAILDKSDTYSVKQAAVHLGVSKEAIYERCGDGRMPCTRIGTRIVITPEQLASYQSEPEQPAAGLRHLS